MTVRPDPTFYASPKIAMEAPAETLAFTLMLSPDFSQSDGIAVIDLDTQSDTYGQIVHSGHRALQGR
jgi:selenium-binding protein 1